ncbi:MAG: shikimate dehydrogenase [Gammaproteobacteria bacterium]|nr:shikimate dehydrogenase [Gammaproteobacteria bacterium]
MDRYGVIGYPVSHSRSPVIHRLFALQCEQQIQYELLQVSADKLEQTVRQFQSTGGKGLNVTAPHKHAVCQLCDQLSERARTATAVNTLAFRDGEIFGDNTDGIGLLRDLAVNLGVNLEGANILILGAGGATSGILGPLLEMQPAMITIANRSVDKARKLAERFEALGSISVCSFSVVPGKDPYDLIINATSAGLQGDTPPYPAAAVSGASFCYDLSYGLKPTPFSAWARERGAAQSVMGWGMLVEQAAESFHIWRGIRPDTAPVLKQMKVNA